MRPPLSPSVLVTGLAGALLVGVTGGAVGAARDAVRLPAALLDGVLVSPPSPLPPDDLLAGLDEPPAPEPVPPATTRVVVRPAAPRAAAPVPAPEPGEALAVEEVATPTPLAEPSPSASSPSPTPSPSASPTTSPSPTASPTATPSAPPSPSPTASPTVAASR